MTRVETDEAKVLTILVERYPYSLRVDEITAWAEFPHGQRTGGVLRRLANVGLIERAYHPRSHHIWATQAALVAFDAFRPAPDPTTEEPDHMGSL